MIILLAGCNSRDPVKSNSPIIAVAPSSLSFTVSFGLASAQDSIIVSNVGTDSLVFSAVSLASWIIFEGQSSNRIFVRVNSSGLSIGTLTDSIMITAPLAANSPFYVPVTITVTENFSLTKSLIAFSALTGSSNPAADSVTLLASGASAIDFNVTRNASWLSVSPTSGTTPQQVIVTPDINGLPGGLYVDTVTFSSAQSSLMSQTLVVRLSLSSWTVATGTSSIDVQGIMFQDSNNGWAGGFLGGGAGTVGFILKTSDGGLSWNINKQLQGSGIARVDFFDNTKGIAVGDSATILQTLDGGNNWNLIPSQSIPADDTIRFWSVKIVNTSTAFVIGTDGVILRTLDGGTSWTAQSSGVTFSLGGISFPNASEGWVVGNAGKILHTANGGNLWTVQNSGISRDLWGVAFTSSSIGWVVGSGGTMLFTTDGGITWEIYDSGVSLLFRNVNFVDANNGWIVGQSGTVMHTNDAGLSWIKQSTPTQVQLFDVLFMDQNLGWVTGTGGTILRTINGGF